MSGLVVREIVLDQRTVMSRDTRKVLAQVPAPRVDHPALTEVRAIVNAQSEINARDCADTMRSALEERGWLDPDRTVRWTIARRADAMNTLVVVELEVEATGRCPRSHNSQSGARRLQGERKD